MVDSPFLGLRRLDLNLLLAFDSLINTCSVSETARRLCVGQPAASYMLKRLRETFGDAILTRRGSAMEPTPFALEMHPRVFAWLKEAQGFLGLSAPFDPALAKGIVRLGMSDLMEMALLPTLLERLQAQAPGMELEVEIMSVDVIERCLEEGKLHAAVGYFPFLRQPLERQRLFEASVRCFYSNRQVTLPSPVTLETLCAYPHIFPMNGGESFGLLDQTLRHKGLVRRSIASISSLLAIAPVLDRIPAVAVLPGFLIDYLPQGHTIRCVPILADSMHLPVDLIRNPQIEKADQVNFFLGVLWDVVQGLKPRLTV